MQTKMQKSMNGESTIAVIDELRLPDARRLICRTMILSNTGWLTGASPIINAN
jgi:hypothetical protein